MESLNDETLTLIEDAQKGKDAFEQLVRRYQHDVFRIIRVYTQNDSDAEDLTQETWIKVYQSIGKLKNPHRFESWLFTIASNTAKNWLKSRAYKESQATDEMQPQQLWSSAMLQYQRQQLIEKIRDAIDSLSEKNRQVVLDFYILGYSAAQISQRLNIPKSTVTGRLQEARKQLRKEFTSMVAQSRIQEKFAPDNLVQNVMDRVASLPTPVPKGNIIERIGRMLPKENLPTIGIATLIAFAVISIISINSGYLQLGGDGNQKESPVLNAQIAFYSDRDGNFEIYVMDADGKNLHNLTNNPADDWAPAWSSDGRKIAFVSNRDGNWDIYIMDSDGKNPHNLTSNPADDEDPAWSPDGQRIAFYSSRDGNREIYIIDSDGKNPHNLTNNPADDEDPAWSPDGQRIAFSSDRNGNFEIYVMDADGKNPRNLTNHPAYDGIPAWSPDGQRITFQSSRDGNFEIYVMDVDGKNSHNLTNHPTYDGIPAWSPDGRKIAFVSKRDGNSEIYVMDADGKNLRNLTNNPTLDVLPDWFDPAFAHPVSLAGKLRAIWGWLKQNSE